MFKLLISKSAEKDLSKLDNNSYNLITSWLKRNIDGCEDPRIHGKRLKGNLTSFWRYRVGDYRILCTINDKELIVLAVRIGHRRDVYDI